MKGRLFSFRDFDWTLLGFVLILSVLSVLEIYSATLHTKFVGFEKSQVVWLTGGLVAMFIVSRIDYHAILDAIPWIYGVFLAALIAVPLVGTKVLGARRWIKFPGGIHFQPSEWVKIILIVAVARYYSKLIGKKMTWGDIFKGIALVAVPMLLVLKQPDLGTALTYSPILLVGLFLGGIPWKKAAILGLAGVLLVGGIWTSGKVLKPYQKARLTSFINPDNDPRGSGYQIRQSLIAVGDGGILGRGVANPGRLPTHSVHRLHFCRLERGARLPRRGRGPAAILPDIDAFDPKRSNSCRPLRNPFGHGRGRGFDLPDLRERWDGHRVYAGHRNSLAVDELRGIFGFVHIHGARHGHERSHESLCELAERGSGPVSASAAAAREYVSLHARSF